MREEPLSVFLAYYDHHLRMNGLNDAEFAESISETEWTMAAVRSGSIPAPLKMCAKIGWDRVSVSVPKTVYTDEYRYINKRGYIDE